MDITEYLPMFLAEGREHLQELNLSVVRIEEHPDDPETVDEIFRIAHSMKGMSATMGFAGMAALTHEMENVFELLRQRSGGLGRDAPPARPPARGGGPAAAVAPPVEVVVDRRVVRIDVQLADDVQMPAVRAYMVLSAIAEKGEVVSSAPMPDKVDAFDGREIHIWLATEEPEEALMAIAGSVPDVAAVQAAVEGDGAEAPAEATEKAAAAPAQGASAGHKTKGASTVR